ncbi:MAG: HIT domain-containing protein [Caldisericales bacterium]|nr:HIT domain-containing protein [Caldisericales bacterium]
MKNIFTPWRMDFIKSKKPEHCVFCKAGTNIGGEGKDFIVYRGEKCFVILNRYPCATGHIMIIPYRHCQKFEDLGNEELSEMMILAKKFVSVLKRAFSPDGFNMGMNLGAAAGAGIADHVHLHIVPRWVGDTNFMPIFAEVKIHPTDLEGAYKAILQALEVIA